MVVLISVKHSHKNEKELKQELSNKIRHRFPAIRYYYAAKPAHKASAG
jgi:hypothetical protein